MVTLGGLWRVEESEESSPSSDMLPPGLLMVMSKCYVMWTEMTGANNKMPQHRHTRKHRAQIRKGYP